MARLHDGRARGAARATALVVALATLAAGALPPAARAVVAGTKVDQDEHPAVVRLAAACTATLVAPRRLLTAAHCIGRVLPGETTVRIAGERFRAVRVARHPRFQYLTPDFPAEPYRDVALVELDRPAPVPPVRVSRHVVRPGTPVVLLGYGTSSPDRTSDFGVLRRAALVTRDAETCRTTLERAAAGQGAQYRDRVMLCTQDPDGARPFASGCYGDSGGPLLRVRAGRPSVLVGVDSWGVACGDRDGDPEVFARASAEWDVVHAENPGWSRDPIEEPFVAGRF